MSAKRRKYVAMFENIVLEFKVFEECMLHVFAQYINDRTIRTTPSKSQMFPPVQAGYCCCLFGFNVVFNKFSVISRRCLVATGSSVFAFIVLPH